MSSTSLFFSSAAPRRRLAFLSVVVACVLNGVLCQAQEPWYVVYERGVEAFRDEAWPLAEADLVAARRDGPAEGRNVKAYGLRFIEFMPSYYLGLVYFSQERYAPALEELERVRELGLVEEGDSELPRMLQIIEQASAHLQPPPPPSQPPEDTSRTAEANASSRLAARLLDRGDVEGARSAIDQTRELQPGHESLPALQQRLAAMEAEQREAHEPDVSVEPPVETRVAAEPSASERAERRFETDLNHLTQLQASGEWGRARELSDRLMKSHPSDAELLRLRAIIESREAQERISDILRAGVRAFYEGNYESAVAILEPVTTGQTSASAPALFYLACSRASLALWTDGDEREALAEQARTDYVRARTFASPESFDRRWISPRIWELLTTEAR